jgi:basic membrane protein A and related proteins
MSKKRILSILATVAVVTTLFAGCKSTPAPAPTPTTPAPAPAAAKLKIGLVTDQGGVNDGSFNQSAFEGIKKAATDLGVTAQQPLESKSQDQYKPNLETMSSAVDLTVGCGFMMEQVMSDVSKQVSNKKFLIIDGEVKNPNVVSIKFKEHEGSFLAGVIAAKTTKTGKIGFVGGMEGDVINRFESGFIAGIMSVDPNMAKDLMPKDEKTPGPNAVYVASFDDSGKGYEAAKRLYNSGVDIIYHAAGGAGLGVFKAAKEMGKFAIGVDSDQAVSTKGYADVILFSMEKKVGVAVYNAVKDLQGGKFAGGTLQTLGIKEGGVGIAPTVNAAASKDGVELAKKAEAQIKAGTIVVPGTRAELLKFKAAEIK